MVGKGILKMYSKQDTKDTVGPEVPGALWTHSNYTLSLAQQAQTEPGVLLENYPPASPPKELPLPLLNSYFAEGR